MTIYILGDIRRNGRPPRRSLRVPRPLGFERLEGRSLLSAGPWEGEACDGGLVCALAAAAASDDVPPEVLAVDVPAGLVRSVGITFSESVNAAALIANGSIVQAVTLLNVSSGAVSLTAGQFRYDAGSAALTLQFASALSAGRYELQLDGSKFKDDAGNLLVGGEDGVLSTLPKFVAPVNIQAKAKTSRWTATLRRRWRTGMRTGGTI